MQLHLATDQAPAALQVKHPSKLVASEFGNLREDNLQLILVARRITDKIVTIR